MRRTSTRAFAVALACVLMTAQLAMPSPAASAAAPSGSTITASSPRIVSYAYRSGFAFDIGNSITLAVGDQAILGLVSEGAPIVWKSSDAGVATVGPTGAVSAKHAGTARITAENTRTHRSVACIVKTYERRTQSQVRKRLRKLKKTHRTGRRWTNSNYYYWQAANCHCYGCAAFAALASDKAFGRYAPFRRHTTFSGIKAGDHVRIGGKHSVVVLRKKKKVLVVAEANYHRAIKWGRKISYSKLKRQGFYVETRYG